MNEVFFQLSSILGITVVVSLLLRLLRQPLIIGYLLVGVLVGPYFFGIIHAGDAVEVFAQMGVAFLLFIIGLGLHPYLIREIGKTAVIAAIAQVGITTLVGFFISRALGIDTIASWYLAFAFTLSSTVIVVRLLHSKGEQNTLHGRISIGFLLVQDFITFFVFLFLSNIQGASDLEAIFWSSFIKILSIAAGMYLSIRFILPIIERIFIKNAEILFLFSIAFCFLVASIFQSLHLSLELGALSAGFMLSFSRYHREIASRIQPLRDFFIIAFFVVLGSQLPWHFSEFPTVPLIVFSVFILIGNPLIMLWIMSRMGYTKRTSFFTALTSGQVSEFSFILLAMGVTLGHISPAILTLATFVGIIAIAFGSYGIVYNRELYVVLEKFITFFERKDRLVEKKKTTPPIDLLLFGCHRLGGGIVAEAKKMKLRFLVVDYDPYVVEMLKGKGIPSVFGSADDVTFLESLPLSNVRMILSTIPEGEVNLSLYSYLREHSPRAIQVAVANEQKDAEELYAMGVDFVVTPPYLGRRYLVDLLKKHKLKKKEYVEERKRHLHDLAYTTDGIV